MTPKQRDAVAMRFLVEEFIEVSSGREPANRQALERLQDRAARLFLPGPHSGGLSLQQLCLVGMRAARFQRLRHEVRDWLRSLVKDPRAGHRRKLKGPLTFTLKSVSGRPNRLRAPFVEGPALDVFWFYLVYLLSRVELPIGVCRAPKSQRQVAPNPELDGYVEPCDRLFLRRGQVKAYCSDLCRARVASQRARSPKRHTGARTS